MTKQDFLEQLRISLAGLDASFINSNIEYYSSYIDSQIRMGKREEEVMKELGDPRLIAKTLHETTNEKFAQEFIEEEVKNKRTFSFNNKEIPLWLVKLVAVIVILGVFFLVISLVSFLLPYIFIIAMIYYVFKLIKKSW
ncbi:MAG: DUF1700 domain-containing protein [Lachnospiraceae bacterium]